MRRSVLLVPCSFAIMLAGCHSRTTPAGDPTRGANSASSASPRYAAVAAGQDHTCALTTGGVAVCWGNNRYGQLGIGTTGGSSATPVAVRTPLRFVSLSAGAQRTCGITSEGNSYCWGVINEPVAPGKTFFEKGDSTPVRQAGTPRVSSLAVGDRHTCALATTGETWCWGMNGAGQLGGGSPTAGGPTLVSGGLRFTHLSAANAYTCGVTDRGDAHCWGLGYPGEMVNGSILRRPTLVKGGRKFTTVAAGWDLTCGLSAMGAAYCWGPDSLLRLGSVSVGGIATPVTMPAGISFASVGVGLQYACASATDGTVWCWRDEFYSRLGPTRAYIPDVIFGNRPGKPPEGGARMVLVAGEQRFAAISSGTYHTCGVTTDHLVYCWGDNNSGQLGDGTKSASAAPVRARDPAT
jgi:alpha-tubulin suppressor-like RCC1 family protein